ncbi:hypothetical protein [Streptococcus sp. E17BB]|uniref:hypothetical protein n=1 Tax=Streptococcus sp. E17BB TaxID=3278714 RepID=UPI00359D5B98
MSEVIIKKCLELTCEKEVHQTGAYFCGEHEKGFRRSRKFIVGSLLTLATSAVLYKLNNKDKH